MKFSEKQDTIGIMRRFGKVFLWVIFPLFLGFGSNEVYADSVSLFGRYVGVLKHESLKKEQLAKLDFIVSRSSSNELELKAILSLHFGDFKSGEYISYHYDKVRYNVLTGALVFDNPDQPLSILVKGFSAGKLVGEVSSIWAGHVGQLVLGQTEKEVKPVAPLIEPIGGEYSGSCGNENARVQLYTMRSTEDLAHLAQPFGAYSIKGVMPIACKDGHCTKFQFVNGAYNFFATEGQLTLTGPRLSLRCDVNGDNLHCKSAYEPTSYGYDLSSCSLKRISNETAGPRQFSPVEHRGAFSPSSSKSLLSPEGIKALQSGVYRGYVFHEHLGIYQAASLDVNLFQAGSSTEGGAKISAFARLFFGDFKSKEFIPYRFQERAYPNPLLGSQNLVFDRIDANMDCVIQITEVNDGVIRGNWYSIIFGRVGPFELRKEGLPSLPDGAKKMERLSGTYLATEQNFPSRDVFEWFIQLQVSPGIKPPTTTENPFFPNLLTGVIYAKNLTHHMGIQNGSYDFYTGRFGFIQEPSGIGSPMLAAPENPWIGSHNALNAIQLHQVASPVMGPLYKFRSHTFKLIQEFP